MNFDEDSEAYTNACAAGCATRVQELTGFKVNNYSLTPDLDRFSADIAVVVDTAVSVIQSRLLDETRGFRGVDVRTTASAFRLHIVLEGCRTVAEETTCGTYYARSSAGLFSRLQVPFFIKVALVIAAVVLAVTASLSYDDALILQRTWQQTHSIRPLATTPSTAFVVEAALLRLRTMVTGT